MNSYKASSAKFLPIRCWHVSTKLPTSAAALVMLANGSFDLLPHGSKWLGCRQASTIMRAQRCLGGVKVNAKYVALANNLPTRRPNLNNMGRGGTGEEKISGGHR